MFEEEFLDLMIVQI